MTLAVPYYGNLYHRSSGYERVYFLVSYDTESEQPKDIRMGVWDESQSPDLFTWLKENGVFGVVCRDGNSHPMLERIVKTGISVFGQGNRSAQNIMNKLLL